MNFFDSIMTGQLNQASNNTRPSNKLRDDNEPNVQQILIEENFSFYFIKENRSATHQLCWASRFSQFIGYQ